MNLQRPKLSKKNFTNIFKETPENLTTMEWNLKDLVNLNIFFPHESVTIPKSVRLVFLKGINLPEGEVFNFLPNKNNMTTVYITSDLISILAINKLASIVAVIKENITTLSLGYNNLGALHPTNFISGFKAIPQNITKLDLTNNKFSENTIDLLLNEMQNNSSIVKLTIDGLNSKQQKSLDSILKRNQVTSETKPFFFQFQKKSTRKFNFTDDEDTLADFKFIYSN